MSFIVAFVIISIIISVVILIMYNNSNESNIIYQDIFCKYLGGYPDIEGGRSAKIGILTKDFIVIQIGNNTKTIKKNDLINAEIMSEQSIVQNVSLGKIIAFGVFALGMKNPKTIVKNYLILTYKENEKEISIIIDSNNLERLTRELRQVINSYKLK